MEQNGVELEVDPNAYSGGEDEEEDGADKRKNFSQDEVWQHINHDCMQAPDSTVSSVSCYSVYIYAHFFKY